MNNLHNLKTWPPYYEQIVKGTKRFELRINDRDYGVGDVLKLWEWDPNTEDITGRKCLVEVLSIIFYKDLREMAPKALGEDYCILSIKPLGWWYESDL